MSFICNFTNRSSGAYKFSVYSKDDPDLLHLKQLVKDKNERLRTYARKHQEIPTWYGELQCVKLMARGSRRLNGKLLHSNADSSLRHQYAEYFDVYVHSSYENYWLQRELETGMTRSEMNKYDKHMSEARWLEWQGKRRLAA